MSLMTRDAGYFNPPITQPVLLDYATARPGGIVKKRERLGNRYFAVLCICLLGYALGGRGFAYWGVNPLFVGEIMLGIGVLVLIKLRMVSRLLSMRVFLPLLSFMVWGACRTVPFLESYQKDAIRDAVLWGYGTYAFIVAGLLISSPERIKKLVLNGRKFVFWFLIFAPAASVISSFFDESLPTFPGGTVPIIQVKGGDLCVHLAGCFAYVVALGQGLNPWLTAILVPFNLALNIQGRAGMVAFAVSCTFAMLLRPFHPRMMRIFFVIALGLFVLWASDIRVEKGARELSFRQLVKGVGSIVGQADDDALSGSKEWRMKWWSDIVGYTVKGPYFWTGKGFGVNLATDDGYQVEGDDALRSPHNGHMTVLARTGVPGITLWVFIQVTWGIMIVQSYFRAYRAKHINWSGLFMFLGVYWAAFLANAAFDVFLEGPMGGIWFYCIYGAGIGAVVVYKRHPDLLTPSTLTPVAA